jgi:hypothetical protein
MNSEEEFVSGVWRKVSLLEWEELEKQRVLIYDKKLKKKERLIYPLVILATIISSSIVAFVIKNLGIYMVIAFIILTLVFAYEYFLIDKCDVIK